jgi:hypothetical protein
VLFGEVGPDDGEEPERGLESLGRVEDVSASGKTEDSTPDTILRRFELLRLGGVGRSPLLELRR